MNKTLQWIHAMRRGEFAEAWKISDAQLNTQQDLRIVPRHLQRIWNGTPVKGRRVLVRCYHGLGDTVQFIRYAALLKEVATKVMVWVQPSLIPLLHHVAGIDQLLPLHEGEPDVEYDVDVEINELPYVFRTTLATMPSVVPYLHVESASLPRSDRLQVGVIWQAGDWDERRSVPFSEIENLLQRPEVDWHILQRDPWRAGWNGKFGEISGGDNPLDDARVMKALDLIISVDTFTAHLAGALGKPAWTLLPADADWRWMLERTDSPWYPTMRLFRQKKEGDWAAVIDEVASELESTDYTD
jgi:hypothetical protein